MYSSTQNISGVRLVAFFLVSLSTCFLLAFSNLFFADLLILVVYALSLVSLCRNGSLLSPIIWFVPFNLAYSIPYPIYVYFFLGDTVHLKEFIFISFVSLFAFSIVNIYSSSDRVDTKLNFEVESITRKYILILSILVLLVALYAISIGVSSKREYLNAAKGDVVLRFIVIAHVLSFSYFFYLVNKSLAIGKLYIDRYFFVVLVAMFLLFAIMGERDFVFRLFLVAFLLYCHLRFASTRFILFFMLVVAIFLLPITQFMKGFLVTGLSLADSNAFDFESILFGEFASSSRNIHMLITYDWQYDYGYSLFTDLLRSLPVFGGGFSSTTQWYNEVYRVNHGIGGTSGWGFSLAGQGLITGGYLGVFVVFFLVGIISRIINSFAMKSSLSLAVYLVFISAVIYALRADLANLLSQGIKNPIFALISLLIFFKCYSVLLVRK